MEVGKMKYEDKVKLIKAHVQAQTPELDEQEILNKAVIKPKSEKKGFKFPLKYGVAFSVILLFLVLLITFPRYDKSKDSQSDPYNNIGVDYQSAASVLMVSLYEDIFVEGRTYQQTSDEVLNFINYYLPTLEYLSYPRAFIINSSRLFTVVDGTNTTSSFKISLLDGKINVQSADKVYTIAKTSPNHNVKLTIKKDEINYINLVINSGQPNIFLIEVIINDLFVSKSMITMENNRLIINNQKEVSVKHIYEITNISNQTIFINVKIYNLDELISSQQIEAKIDLVTNQYQYKVYQDDHNYQVEYPR